VCRFAVMRVLLYAVKCYSPKEIMLESVSGILRQELQWITNHNLFRKKWESPDTCAAVHLIWRKETVRIRTFPVVITTDASDKPEKHGQPLCCWRDVRMAHFLEQVRTIPRFFEKAGRLNQLFASC